MANTQGQGGSNVHTHSSNGSNDVEDDPSTDVRTVTAMQRGPSPRPAKYLFQYICTMHSLSSANVVGMYFTTDRTSNEATNICGKIQVFRSFLTLVSESRTERAHDREHVAPRHFI